MVISGLKKSDKKLNDSSVQNIYFYALQILAFNKKIHTTVFLFLRACQHHVHIYSNAALTGPFFYGFNT